jgi:putative transposase
MLPGVPLHLIQRGNNRQACFFSDSDFQLYLEWLEENSLKAGCQIHAYALMTNHIHLLLTPESSDSASHLMKFQGQRYVQYINRKYNRTGTLWEGRFRSCIVQQERYLLVCQRYIEMNPVRAGLVRSPDEYRWSSFAVNGLGARSSLITPHPLYLELGRTAPQRMAAYRELFCQNTGQDSEEIDRIRQATNGNFALGENRFIDETANKIGRRLTPGKPGRPKKPTT